jgi:hypothetical protein
MPTATKSARIKEKKPVTVKDTALEENEGDADVIPAKKKKPLEIDELEPVSVVEEKIEEDPLIGATEEDELASDEATLDTEELNPFGDRWEE